MYGNGLYVALSTNYIGCLNESTGEWTVVPSFIETNKYDNLCYGKGIFIFLSYDAEHLYTSTDGINWEI